MLLFLDEISSNCYCLSSIFPDIWFIIFKFLCVRDIANPLVNQKLCWLTFLHKTVNKFSRFSKKNFKIKILTELKSFLKEFAEELKLHFDFSELIYFNYCLSFFDSFDLDQFLLHLVFCSS